MNGDIYVVLPEVGLALASMALLMFGAYGDEDRRASAILWACAA